MQKLKAGARRGRRHDLVRHGPARERRRLRPQDPEEHRALLVLHPGRLRRRPSAGWRPTSAASGATRSTARATWPTTRSSSCPCASTRPTRAARASRTSSRPCTSPSWPAASLAGVRAAPEGAAVRPRPGRRERAMSATRPRPAETQPSVDSAAPLARPRLVHRGDARLLPRPRGGGRRARPARAAEAPHHPLRPVGPGQDLDPARRHRARGCGPRAIARCTCASTTRRSRRRPPSRSSRRSSARRESMGTWTQAGTAVEGESLWEFLHHRDDILQGRRRQDRHPAADLRPVRGDLHAGAGRRRRPQARRAVRRGPRGPGREPPAQGARGEDRDRRLDHRALRLRPRRLPHPHRAARGLPRAPGGPEGGDALHHPEPHAAGAHERPAGARRGDEARREARLARRSPRRSCASSPAARSCATPRSSPRSSPSSAASSTTRASRRDAPRSPPTCSRARTTPSSRSSTSARSRTSPPACAR